MTGLNILKFLPPQKWNHGYTTLQRKPARISLCDRVTFLNEMEMVKSRRLLEWKPNSITLASSELAPNMFEAGSCQIPLH